MAKVISAYREGFSGIQSSGGHLRVSSNHTNEETVDVGVLEYFEANLKTFVRGNDGKAYDLKYYSVKKHPETGEEIVVGDECVYNPHTKRYESNTRFANNNRQSRLFR